MMPAAKILIVDDDETSRYVKAHVLTRHGYGVSEATRGAEALKSIEAERPQLVLLDVRLPDANGIDLCRTIKARHPGTVVLQTSAAFTNVSDRVAGLEGGADSYLIEPIEPEELVAQVGSLLRLSRAEQELREINELLEERVAERTRELIEANRRLALEAEQRARMEEMLRHAEKLDALGQLTGGIAHDFNNLLTVVLGNLDSLEQWLAGVEPKLDSAPKLLAGARRAAQDGALLTRQLLAFSRRDALRSEVIDPGRAVGGFEQLLRNALGERISLTLTLAADCWPIRVDRSRLEAALLNLAINARDAMPGGGSLRLTMRNRQVDAPSALPSQVALAADAPPGDYVEISIEDTGCGMTEAVLQHAFDPFFTTKDVGHGTGLGLSQVYGFVRQSGGFLTVESKPGAGTRFDLLLPRAEPAPKATVHSRPAKAVMPGGSETVLIVEDNEMVLEFAVSAISSLGYRVLVAATADAALETLRSGQHVDLMFTDVILPQHTTGIELAQEARRLRPGFKVLLTSGYGGASAESAPEGGEFPLLSKPYRQVELADRLREVLSSKSEVTAG